MADGSKRPARGRAALLALALALTATGFVAAANIDSLVERGFSVALKGSGTPDVRAASLNFPVAGTEDYWLSTPGHEVAVGDVTLASMPGPVRLGAKLTLAVAGEKRIYEVVDMTAMPTGITRVDTSDAARLVVVTLREAGKPDGALLRLVGEAGAGHKGRDVAIAPSRPL